MNKSILLVPCIVLAISGCGLAKQARDQESLAAAQAQQNQLIEQSQKCYESLKNDPSAQLLAGKVALNVSDQTIPMYANDKKPTAKEKQAIVALYDKAQECRKYSDAAIKLLGVQEFNDINAANQSATQQLVVNLYSGKITYGQFATGRKNVEEETQKAIVLTKDMVNRRMEEQQARDKAARQKAWSNFGDALIAAGTPPASSVGSANSNLPKTTSCSQQGVFFNCMTY